MVFAGEIVGQGRAYLAGAYDEYIHGMSAFLFLVSLVNFGVCAAAQQALI